MFEDNLVLLAPKLMPPREKAVSIFVEVPVDVHSPSAMLLNTGIFVEEFRQKPISELRSSVSPLTALLLVNVNLLL